ncbi:hypothetical protein EG68_10867 [Paragonimus skrjabini miyazakii]|uniref:HIG1 domain-containing protein n=1 Tax=Paragonimus skrjabini miyazakii TaxID=59628 RepID=A0A8S9YJ06_9TREM|nr:hypothetical protein EG68_10867 [Paragonimus skrjabini miyazakii]
MSEGRFEGFRRLYRMTTTYPEVVAGLIFTGCVLFRGMRLATKPGCEIQAQRMMRWRIYGQGGTIAFASYLVFSGLSRMKTSDSA